MPARGSTRSVTLDPTYQNQQDIYAHPSSDVTGRLRTRNSVNYAPQNVPSRPQDDGRLRNRSSRISYKEEDDDFVPDDGVALYGVAATRPRRGQHQPQTSYGDSYAVQGGDDDDVYQPEQTTELKAQQTTTTMTTRHRESTAASNGTVDPAAITTKEEKVEVAVTQRGRVIRKKTLIESSEEDEEVPSAHRRISRRGNEEFIAPDNEDDEEVDAGDDSFGQPRLSRLTRSRATEQPNQRATEKSSSRRKKESRSHKKSRKRTKEGSEDDYVDESDDSDDVSDEEMQRTSPSLPPTEDEQDDGDVGPKTYGFRSRHGQPTTYNEIAAFEKMEQNGAATKKKSKPKKAKMNWTGKDYENAWGPLPGQSDSDSDRGQTPRKLGGLPGIPATPGEGGMLAGGAGLPLDVAGTPSNLGRIGESGLADADPLGVNVNVSFDDVGGLDEHVSKLKEMTLLPLLYPDMFQHLGVTPPRGVLFHGPPGTGKTLVARALAASCRSEGRSVSFFMRKGADCLSKWVGEAERQLRLLFEEARKVQPSIIFFDEIDGLAPVRSSKQDQIHASIVSTLLALMDGMDGRGQVIVIGATNRPDAIDPALRRPGRFDREFYFPLPNFDARVKILEIMTKPWDNWKGLEGDESRKRLAKLTKGYGGADLRALCTEAALNAIQRQYPQIYQSSERLLLDHAKIAVQARDFMISVKEVVPSSARSTASAAAPLPQQLVPLLDQPLQKVKDALDRVLPKSKKRSALEEAQWEEDHPDGEAGAFEREMMLQTLESQRVNRPRLLLYGPAGMGQRAVGAAALHHLEGYSVQSFDLGTLTGDSARTPEAAVVQLFIEAKRHAPSIIYIPSLTALCGVLPESCRALVGDSLESLEPHEPILLLAIMTGSFKSLPRDVRAWFGKGSEGRVAFDFPNEASRRKFFQELLDYVKKPPILFPDAVKRRRRILEVLPVAPPLPPRELSAAELAAQERQDTLLFYKLKSHLSSIFGQCRKADSKFCKGTIGQTVGSVQTEDGIWWGRPRRLEPSQPAPDAATNGVTAEAATDAPALEDGGAAAPTPATVAAAAAAGIPAHGRNRLHDIDMVRIHDWIWEGRYHTSTEFLNAIRLVRENAEMEKNDDYPETKDTFRRADKIYGIAQEEVGRTEPMFNLETERMAKRFRERERKAREARAKAEEAKEKEETVAREGEDTAMTLTSPHGELNAEERSALKRTREDASNESDGSHPPSKRMRTSPLEDSAGDKNVRFASDLPSIAVNGGAIPDSDMADSYDPPSPSPAGKPSVSNNGDNSAMETNTVNKEVAPLGLTQHVIFTPSRTPSPGPSTPPEFIVSPTAYSALEETLASKTANLDVEQLEALRALCLNLVWSHRGDWDRTTLMSEMTDAIHRYLVEVGEMSEEE